jgi:hypothetical protein
MVNTKKRLYGGSIKTKKRSLKKIDNIVTNPLNLSKMHNVEVNYLLDLVKKSNKTNMPTIFQTTSNIKFNLKVDEKKIPKIMTTIKNKIQSKFKITDKKVYVELQVYRPKENKVKSLFASSFTDKDGAVSWYPITSYYPLTYNGVKPVSFNYKKKDGFFSKLKTYKTVKLNKNTLLTHDGNIQYNYEHEKNSIVGNGELVLLYVLFKKA